MKHDKANLLAPEKVIQRRKSLIIAKEEKEKEKPENHK